ASELWNQANGLLEDDTSASTIITRLQLFDVCTKLYISVILPWHQYVKENKKRMHDQLFVDQKLQTQKKEVNTEQQQHTKCIKMVATPLQAILKDDNESVLNTLRKGQRIASDALLDISIIIELIVEDYLQSGENKLD
ncbi:hypothetical protein CU097_005127, partial [Rhizopus azygosporus]